MTRKELKIIITDQTKQLTISAYDTPRLYVLTSLYRTIRDTKWERDRNLIWKAAGNCGNCAAA